MSLSFDTPLASIEGVQERFASKLSRLGIKTVRDLLFHLPSRYEDFSHIYSIAEVEPHATVTIQGAVEDVRTRHSFRRHMAIVEAVIADASGSIRAVWFNQPYVAHILRPGRVANFSGKISAGENGLYLNNPAYELLSPRHETETRHTGRLVPIYPETRGLTSKGIRFLVKPILDAMDPEEWIPEEILRGRSFPGFGQALRDIHFPADLEGAERARRRFAFEDLFLLQLQNLREKAAFTKRTAPPIAAGIPVIKKILAELPFELTVSQKQALWEIVKDIAKPGPMNRLLQGDVGSGKTAVAAAASLLAAGAGLQTACMAPTEVLAKQHFETFEKLFAGLASVPRPSLCLLTAHASKILYADGLEGDVKKKELLSRIAGGEIQIVLGTHSLLQNKVSFRSLGLVVIDEQHRFGVAQRAKLLEEYRALRGNAKSAKLSPHFLSMSATPIPRTLMLGIFGDLDVSRIMELPQGRRPIKTSVVPPEKRRDAYGFIRREIKKGRQAFVICPRIEPPEGGALAASSKEKMAKLWEVKSVKEEFEKLSNQIFPDLRVGMLHGQMRAPEKERIMREFRAGNFDILVSTSVVEVGVDVPNASIMMIEGSDRFGLAQLYQFRGRVGRGGHQSYCLLFTDSTSGAALARLKAIIEAKSGFDLAEKDLEIRGPGQFFGETQSGLPDVAMEALKDPELVKSAREAASSVLNSDPLLRHHAALAARLGEFSVRVHRE